MRLMLIVVTLGLLALRAIPAAAQGQSSAVQGRVLDESGAALPGVTVVVTHHGPNPLSIAPRFVGNALNAGFVSDLTPLMAGVDLWLHGHVHDSFDYRVGGCRVVANPAGYVLNGTVEESHAWFELENGEFDPMLVLEVVRATASG